MIIDASVAVKWLIEEAQSDLARGLLDRADLSAPSLLFPEVANALWKSVMRGQTDPMAPLREQMEDLSKAVTTVDESHVMPRALELAILFKHSVYHCVYLALAERLNDDMVTADDKFVQAVGADPLARLLVTLQ